MTRAREIGVDTRCLPGALQTSHLCAISFSNDLKQVLKKAILIIQIEIMTMTVVDTWMVFGIFNKTDEKSIMNPRRPRDFQRVEKFTEGNLDG